MDNNRESELQQQEPEQFQEEPKGYIPRPLWQVWAARIGLVIFILFLILEYVKILQGGA